MKKIVKTLIISFFFIVFFPVVVLAQDSKLIALKIELSNICIDNAIMVEKIKDLFWEDSGSNIYLLYDKQGKNVGVLPSTNFYAVTIKDLVGRSNQKSELFMLKEELEKDFIFLLLILENTQVKLSAK
jgi:hypothetical protein